MRLDMSPQNLLQIVSTPLSSKRIKDSRSFKIEKGVRQGCVLSTVFFNMYCEELVNEALQDEAGLVLKKVIINNIRFADYTI